MESSNKISVAFIIPNLELAGAESMVVQLAVNLSDKYEPILIVMNQKINNRLQQKLDRKEIECIFYGKKEKNSILRKIKQLIWLNNILKIKNPDLIHVHLDYYFSWIYAYVHKKRIITTIHSQAYRINNIWTIYMLKRLDKRNLIKIVTLTNSMASEFKEVLKFESNEIEVINNFVNCKDYYTRLDRKHKKEITSTIKFTFIARFHPIKNHHLLINSFQLLQRELPNVILQLAGNGPLFEEIIKTVQDMGLIDKVHFLGEVEDVAELLNDTDIYVISSDSEAFPITLLEAMASGLPIVATAVGGIVDIMNENGILVEKGNSKQFYEGMKTLATDKKVRELYGKKSLEIVSKYDINTVVKRYESLYLEEFELC